jgi:integrase
MASLWKRSGSPYWFACFTGPRGERLKKSTKQTDRKKAMAVCLEWSRAADSARQGTLTEAQARKVVSEIIERATGEPLAFHTAESWLQGWMSGKEQTKAATTAARYSQVVRDFIAHLGKRANLNISHISAKDIQDFRDAELAAGKSPRTCNVILKVIGAGFNAARRQGLIANNPVEALEGLPYQQSEKETFSAEQISALLAAAPSEWKGAVLLAYYTGARLRDVSLMRWDSVDLPSRVIRFTPRKTQKSGKPVVVPLHPELENHLLELPSPERGSAFVFPTLAKKSVKGSGGEHGLSSTFKRIMANAGVISAVSHKGKGKGRATNSLSFHSLRHSFNSAMANAGVSQEVRQKLTGHASAEMNKIYTHHEIEPLRAAISLIPSVQTPTESK